MYSPKIGRNFGRKGGVKGGKYRFKAIILLATGGTVVMTLSMSARRCTCSLTQR